MSWQTSWRKLVHRVTGKCMARTMVLTKAEVRIEFGTDCDGESLTGAGLYKFGELVDAIEGSHGEVIAKMYDWLENDRP